MKKNVSAWILFLSTSLLVACQASLPAPQSVTVEPTQIILPTATEPIQPTPLPVEFAWKIAGDPNPFNAPVGVAIDAQGNMYVMDVGNSRVQKFGEDGNYLLMWGGPGEGDGQFAITFPDEGRLAVDSQGNVYVLDVSNFRIQKFDSNGNFLTKWGTKGKGEGQFAEPSDIAIDKQNNVYIVDYNNRIVQKFDENGKFILRWGSTESAPFAGLYSVAIDPDGNVLVADESGRIQKFDSSGKFLSIVLPRPREDSDIDPWNIAVDDQGNIYVADHGGFRVVKLNSQGVILSAWRGKDTGAALFNSLQDIALDEKGNIYVTDSASNLVQKFRQLAFHP